MIFIKNSNNIIIDSIKTENFTINITSTITDTSKSIKNIKSNFHIYLDNYKIKISALLLIILTISFLVFFIRRKIIKKNISIYSQINFLENSIRDIKKINIPNLNLEGIQKFNLEVSDILKKYLKDILYINSTEMTMDEIIVYLREKSSFGDIVAEYSNLLNQIEKLKFAKSKITIEHLEEIKNNSIDFIKKANSGLR